MASFGTLVISAPNGTEQVVELTKPQITIGREVGNDVILNDARVSRFHARIDCGPEGCTITDLGSSNGTLVNGQRISEPVFITGANIALGSHRLVYRPPTVLPGGETPAPSAATLVDSFPGFKPQAAPPPQAYPTPPHVPQPPAPYPYYEDEREPVKPATIILATAGVMMLLAVVGCILAFLLGLDPVVIAGLEFLNKILPGIAEPLQEFYTDLHGGGFAEQPPEQTVEPAATEPPQETEEPASEITEEPPVESPPPEENPPEESNPPPPPQPKESPSVTVINQSDTPFCGVFIRMADSVSWGDNWMTTPSIAIGQSQKYVLSAAGTYDLRVLDCSNPRRTLENKLDVVISGPYEWVLSGHYGPPVTATPTPTFTPIPTPTIESSVSISPPHSPISCGSCTTMSWDLEGISSAYLNGQGVVGHDSRSLCPTSDKTYTLQINFPDGSTDNYSYLVEVLDCTPEAYAGAIVWPDQFDADRQLRIQQNRQLLGPISAILSGLGMLLLLFSLLQHAVTETSSELRIRRRKGWLLKGFNRLIQMVTGLFVFTLISGLRHLLHK